MKLAIISQPIDGVLPPDQTSLGIWTYETALRLAALGDEVTVYAPRQPGGPRTVVRDGVTYRFVRTGPTRARDRLVKLIGRVRRRPRTPLYARAWFDAVFAVQAALGARRRGADVVHVQNWVSLVPIIARVNRAKVIGLHMHCEWLSQLDRDLMRRRIDRVDRLIGCSAHIVSEVTRAFQNVPGVPEKCTVVPNGVDTSRFSPAAPLQAAPRVVFVGRISPEKGVHDLLAAMEQVRLAAPGVHVDLVGPVGAVPAELIVDVSDEPTVAGLRSWYSGDYGDRLRALMSAELATAVTFHGVVSHEQVIELIRGADLLVNPSYSEAFGMSLVEAMACGRPVVATRVGGMPMIVEDGLQGLLVAVGDIDGLAGAITALLRDPKRRADMGRAGRARAERCFTWARVAQAVHDVYVDDANRMRPCA